MRPHVDLSRGELTVCSQLSRETLLLLFHAPRTWSGSQTTPPGYWRLQLLAFRRHPRPSQCPLDRVHRRQKSSRGSHASLPGSNNNAAGSELPPNSQALTLHRGQGARTSPGAGPGPPRRARRRRGWAAAPPASRAAPAPACCAAAGTAPCRRRRPARAGSTAPCPPLRGVTRG